MTVAIDAIGAEVTIRERNREVARFDKPAPGRYVLRDGAPVPIATVSDAAVGEFAFEILEDGDLAGLQVPDTFRPMGELTLAACVAFVDGLTATQFRRLVARLLYHMRDRLPDDIRGRL